jgi:hypothetical protein
MFLANEILKIPYANAEPIPLDNTFQFKKDCASIQNIGVRIDKTSARTSRNGQTIGSNVGNYVSQTDRGKGFVAEEAFAKKCEDHGLQVFALPHFTSNYRHHIDFEIEDGHGNTCWVDVKCPRALRKGSVHFKDDPYGLPQNRYVCLELHEGGSLFASKSDYLAFGQTDGSFLLANRIKLIGLVVKKLKDTKERAPWPECSLWSPYVRTFRGIHSVICYVDLMDISETIEYHLK